jgi:hypothetical protein
MGFKVYGGIRLTGRAAAEVRDIMHFAEAMEATYLAFSGIAKPRAIEGCPCCMPSKNLCNLLKKPLRELSGDDLEAYGSSVFLTLGDLSDFRYFVPRLLELSAITPGWWPSPEVVVGKLKLADFEGWSVAERQAIETLLFAWEDRLLSETETGDGHDISSELDALLCGIALAGLDLSPFLPRLLVPDAQLQLRELYWDNFSGKLGRVKLKNAFWAEDRGLGEPLLAFLESPEVVQRAAR